MSKHERNEEMRRLWAEGWQFQWDHAESVDVEHSGETGRRP